MSILSAAVVTGPAGIEDLHEAEIPQKDNLCGCFWGSLVLKAAGVDADQDAVAAEAGTTLPEGDPSTFVPPGETPRRDYRLELPLADPPGSSGTSAQGLARAVERLGEGRLAVVPTAGPWTGDTVTGLVEAVAAAAPATTIVANVRTGAFWGSRPAPAAFLSVVLGHDVPGPPADWDTGHFVNLAAVVRGPGGALVLVRDSYRSLGWAGHYLQPAVAVAAGLVRGDGREGGVLCFASASDAQAVRTALEDAGYDLRLWDNGSI